MEKTRQAIAGLTLLTLMSGCPGAGTPRLLCPAGTKPEDDTCIGEDAVSELDTSSETTESEDTEDHHSVGATSVDAGIREDAMPPAAACTEIDLPDIAFEDSNCDGMDGDKKLAVFVSPTGSDQGTGDEGQPFATLSKAIQEASKQGRSQVIIAEGAYASEGAVLLAGVSLYGGYDAVTWARSKERSTLITGRLSGVQPSANSEHPSNAPITLSLLTIEAPEARAAGSSSIAMSLSNGMGKPLGEAPFSVRIEDSEVRAGRGADGAAGSAVSDVPPKGNDGLQGVSGWSYWRDSGCSVRDLDPNNTSTVRWGGAAPACVGARTSPGTGGDGGLAGSWSAGGANVRGPAATAGSSGGNQGAMGGDIGRSGNPGVTGSAGSDGAGGLQVGSFDASYLPADGASGVAGAPGQAGGGGGGTDGCYAAGSTCGWVSGATGGGGGSGGCGGAGGKPGRGGGLSAGIYARNIRLTLVRTRVTSAEGGQGGRGTSGVAGAEGGKGKWGGSAGSCGNYYDQDRMPGGRGGDGGHGGFGGTGGSGGGGPSIAVVLIGESELTTDSADNELVSGPGGLGGFGSNQVTAGQPGLTIPLYQPR